MYFKRKLIFKKKTIKYLKTIYYTGDMPMLLKIDKEFEELIPSLSKEDFEGLKKNIKENGCETPLTIWNETIIDGHNRYKICTDEDIPFTIKEVSFNSREDAKLWMIKHELEWKGRRINSYNRVLLGLKYEEIFSMQAKANKAKGDANHTGNQHTRKLEAVQNSSPPPELSNDESSTTQNTSQTEKIEPNKPKEKEHKKTRENIAKIAEVSHDTVAKVKKIEEKATPEIKAKLASNEISINEAHKNIKKQEMIDNHQEQLKPIVEEIKKKRKEKQKKMEESEPEEDGCGLWEVKEENMEKCPCGCGYYFEIALRKWFIKTKDNIFTEVKT